MRIGSVVLATKQGLGYLAKDFYDNGLIHEVFIHRHSTRENHYEWYPNRVHTIEDLLENIDILLCFENLFYWTLIPECRKRGIKVVLIPMYECSPHPFPYEPDLLICPSLLDLEVYKDKNSVYLPIPHSVKWQKRAVAKTFVYNGGNGGLGGRNGLTELLKAMEYVKSPIKLIVRSQVKIDTIKDDRIEYRIGNFDDIWSEGDVFIFPEKFNGLSLPLQEAFASGMLVMTSDRFPNNTYLPKDPLIPVESYETKNITARKFKSAVINPKDIAKMIDEWYGKDITNYSLIGKQYNEENKWQKLKEKYTNLMSQLLVG